MGHARRDWRDAVGVTTVFAELKMNWTASVGRPTLNLGLGFVISATLFAMIYKLMPRAHLQWKDVWGALSLPHCCSVWAKARSVCTWPPAGLLPPLVHRARWCLCCSGFIGQRMYFCSAPDSPGSMATLGFAPCDEKTLNNQPALLSARSYNAQRLAPTAGSGDHGDHRPSPQAIRKPAMNTDHRLLPLRRPTQAAGSGIWAHTLIWVLLVVAALLLAGFTAVVDDITERGELRRMQQRESGAFPPLDDLQTHGVDAERLLVMTGQKLAGR